MSIYVTTLRRRHSEICPASPAVLTHIATLSADTLSELHLMAWRLGLSREWLVPRARQQNCHYILSPQLQALALRAGAVLLNLREQQTYQAKARIIAPAWVMGVQHAS